jgi:hypothetical protein
VTFSARFGGSTPSRKEVTASPWDLRSIASAFADASSRVRRSAVSSSVFFASAQSLPSFAMSFQPIAGLPPVADAATLDTGCPSCPGIETIRQ